MIKNIIRFIQEKHIIKKTISRGDNMTEKEFLETYDNTKYEKPSVTTDVLLFTIVEEENEDIKKVSKKKLKLLLIKRKGHPFKDAWAIPGGFVSIDESLEAAAHRELKEETNLGEDVYLEQLYTYGDVYRDPRMRVISVVYMALTANLDVNQTKAGDDAKEAKWFEVSTIKEGNEVCLQLQYEDIVISYRYDKQSHTMKVCSKDTLAFDHYEIIRNALSRLKNKVEYTDIVFSLLPNKFTLMELQQVYEILLQTKVTKQNFRKKMISKVIKLDEVQEKTGFRPAHYFAYGKGGEK
jgi:ADP-ribose pyrophosphatase YjhB (NUDIX family)